MRIALLEDDTFQAEALTVWLETARGARAELNTRTVDTHVSRLHSKLGLAPERGWKLGAVY